MAKSKTKTFLAIFLGSPAARKRWEKLPAKVRSQREAAGMQAWREWAMKNDKDKRVVYPGAPLGITKRIDRKGVANTHNAMAAFVVVQASSHSEAAKLFKNHPHFMIFPGESVEVMECLPIPGMPNE